MYVVREVFIAKPGNAGKLAKLMKEVAKASSPNARVLLDFATDFNKVILEHDFETLGDFEKELEEFKTKADPALMEKLKGYTELYQTGYREIYKVVE